MRKRPRLDTALVSGFSHQSSARKIAFKAEAHVRNQELLTLIVSGDFWPKIFCPVLYVLSQLGGFSLAMLVVQLHCFEL